MGKAHIFVPKASFTCHQCGLCCRVFPSIEIDHATKTLYQRLLETSDVGTENTLQKHIQLALSNCAGDQQCVLPRKNDGSCIFLSTDNTCHLHASLGTEYKPQLCRDFPFIFRCTPGGIYIGLSFTCPSVVAEKGEPLVEKIECLETAAQQAFRVDRISERIDFDDRYRISWQGYQLIEEGLSNITEQNSVSLYERLSAGFVYLNMLRTWLDTACHDVLKPLEQYDVPDELVERYTSFHKERKFTEIFRIAQKRRGTRIPQRVFLSLITGCAATMWKTGQPVRAGWGFLRQYVAAMIGLGTQELPPLSSRIPYHVLYKDDTERNLSPEVSSMVLNYVSMCLFRKDLPTCPQGILRGWALVILLVKLSEIYAHALSYVARSPLAETTHWADALSLVETYYGHHSKLFSLLSQSPRLSMILDSFFLRKNYSDTILGRLKE